MMSSAMSNEDKKRLAYERQNAVRNAWKEEKVLVKSGHGTRNWTQSEREELLERGSVAGYEGHHMKSVSLYPEYAGDPKNIQFLTESEHLYGAHQGSYHHATNGYYSPETREMVEFEGDELKAVPECELSSSQAQSEEALVTARELYAKDDMLDLSEGQLDTSVISEARSVYETDLNESSVKDYSSSASESNGDSKGIGR